MTTPTRRPAEETGRLGDEIYERDIRHLVEADHHGEFVAIDVESGDYAIADSVLAAADRLRAQRPDADGWLVRIGHPTLRTFGGSSLWSDAGTVTDSHNHPFAPLVPFVDKSPLDIRPKTTYSVHQYVNH